MHAEQLRYFESGLTELARRGHSLCLAFPPVTTPQSTVVADRLTRQFPNVTVDSALPIQTRRRFIRFFALKLQRLLDDLRFLSPRYANFGVVRGDAERRYPSVMVGVLRRITGRPRLAAALASLLGALERRLPISAAARRFVASHPADVILGSPLVQGLFLNHYLRLAQAAGARTGYPVASWDNLTTKGLLPVMPDGLIVWNDAQRQEAIDEFEVAADRIAVVGAHSFDHWFAQTPGPRAAFCARVGLAPNRPYLLYVGSSRRIAPDEPEFVTEWLRALRAQADPRVRDLQVLIRPHYQNSKHWIGWVPPVSGVVVSPALGENPVTDESRSAFFDALSHSLAVVGANTSAMIEAGIAGRPVLTVVSAAFGQESMPHFHYLIDHGLLVTARDLDEHFAQVARAFAPPDGWDASRRRFLETFVRPRGLDRPAAPLFADAVEALARFPREPQSR
jgi:hypothetical protein